MSCLLRVPKKVLGILLSIGIGFIAVILHNIFPDPLFDPFFLSLTIGICLKFFLKPHDEFLIGIKKAPSIFIPVGVVLYGALNLDFRSIASFNVDYIFLIFLVFIIFVLTSLVFSTLLKLNEKTGHLLAAGSAVCGVSAIIITSQANDAESDDISISLIAIFFSALIGLFLLLPLLKFFLRFSDTNYAVLSGAVLQITGFVKVAVRHLSSDAQALAMSIKTLRYTELLFLVPAFGSLTRRKAHIPWFLWGFLIAGILFSSFQPIAITLGPILKPVLNILWSIAMAAVGLNANPRVIFSQKGIKAFAVSSIAFIFGITIFILGLVLGA